MDDPILDNLNDDQLGAVTHERGPLLVLAGAGSGKTRVITRRMAWLIRERSVLPRRILAMTFTNKAAGEMRVRVRSLLGDGRDAPSWLGTFHSMCLRLLRIHAARIGFPNGFVVYDDDDSDALLRRVAKDEGIPREAVGGISSRIDRLKNDGLLELRDPATPRDHEFARIMQTYQEALRAAGAVDFGDLLALTVKLLRDNEDVRAGLVDRFEHVLVDEFQDTNAAQYDIVRLLIGPRRNICVVGDDDQSIYSWRGARVDNIIDFARQFPDATVVTLRNNYRSRSQILTAATRVISRNTRRHDKALCAFRGDGEPVFVHGSFDETQEAVFVVRRIARAASEGVPLSRIAVFYRTNAQSRVFEDAMRNRGIAHRVVGAIRFYQRKEVKDVLAYLRLLVNPADEVALERVSNVPPRGIGAVTLAKAREEAAGSGEPLLMALARVGDASGKVLAGRIAAFIDTITALALLAREDTAEQVVRETLDRTGYLEWLGREDSPESQSRVENVVELLASVRDWGAMSGKADLASWLDQVALVQPLDESNGSEAVSLMTVHAAKGLEFDLVFVAGLEEGLFPLESPGSRFQRPDPARALAALEEERRLMYVAMTRARDLLYLTYAASRMRYGQTRTAPPSRFLSDLPRSQVRVV
ncbi:MAG: UvrD-helicase domain-containing protein [Deltaproteobacteria bacterium]|nr:UvrD-helicase domain-containing protein [Deltaproteobacteria bacterium]